ncbi:hypothetical protein, partial [Brucella gallinifaecis]|uniref:hypothetical protein n=1 Tax=Brucella gallinifaecis TaxID=215590 RepID=UPI0023625CF0
IGDRERAAFGMLTDQEAATASFIVTACNAHAAFLEALTSIKMLSEARGDNRRQQVALFDCHCLAVNALATLASDEVQA